MKLKVHVIISGKVQGVWFRVYTKNKAEQLDLNGWVKNLSNGNVEAVFEGEEDKVNEMLKWCDEGSPQASVNDVNIEIQSPSNGFDRFYIKY